jgi:hypothetical protein
LATSAQLGELRVGAYRDFSIHVAQSLKSVNADDRNSHFVEAGLDHELILMLASQPVREAAASTKEKLYRYNELANSFVDGSLPAEDARRHEKQHEVFAAVSEFHATVRSEAGVD